MREEYLWSKKGSDGEVERLEDLLSEFRYIPDRPFASPIANSEADRDAPRRFRWVIAFAAPAFATLTLGVWFVFQTSEGSLRARVQISEKQESSILSAVEPFTENTSITEATVSKKASRKPTSTIVKTVFRPRATKRPPIDTLTAVNKLTSEEKYAYDRLMLALSIAGNKLKVVQDTIDRKSDFDQHVNNSNK